MEIIMLIVIAIGVIAMMWILDYVAGKLDSIANNLDTIMEYIRRKENQNDGDF